MTIFQDICGTELPVRAPIDAKEKQMNDAKVAAVMLTVEREDSDTRAELPEHRLQHMVHTDDDEDISLKDIL